MEWSIQLPLTHSLKNPDEKISVNEPIEPNKPLSEIRPEPYSLPSGFVWDTLVLDNPKTVNIFGPYL